MNDRFGDQLGLDGSSVPVERERAPDADVTQLALGAFDVAQVLETDTGRVQQDALDTNAGRQQCDTR